MTEMSRYVESQEKFYHVFIALVGALLGAAIQTAKFENLGKYSMISELGGWLCLMFSMIIAILNAWHVQELFYSVWETDRVRMILNDKESSPAEIAGAVGGIDRLNERFAKLDRKFGITFILQMSLFSLGLFCIGFARSVAGLARLQSLWS